MKAEAHARRALRASNTIGQGASVPPDLSAEAVDHLRDIVSMFRLRKIFEFVRVRLPLALVGSTASYATGPGATWDTGSLARPTGVISAARIPVGGTNESPLTMLTRTQYDAIPNKAQTASLPSDYLYEPGAGPNGTSTVYPVPLTAATVVIYFTSPVATFENPQTDVAFPEGYDRMIDLMLADRLLPSMGKSLSADLRLELGILEAAVMNQNLTIPEWNAQTLPRRI